MAKVCLVPSEAVRKYAREHNMLPSDALGNLTCVIPKNAGEDMRRKDKYEINYLEDILITRSDGSRVILHELHSDIKGLARIELSEVSRRNFIESKKIAYFDELDFEKVQADQGYLDCLGDYLLAPDRLAKKQQLAEAFGVKTPYLGYVVACQGGYRKCIRDEREVLTQIRDRQTEKQSLGDR